MYDEGTLIAERYRLGQPIGHGRSGFVWVAHDTRVNRTVAARPVPLERCGGAAAVSAAIAEARRALRFRHEYVMTGYDVFTAEEAVWLVTEYVPGRLLTECVGRGQLSATQVASIGAQLAAAMTAAHTQGLLHRAMEPANVVLGDDDDAVITNFGIGTLHQDQTYCAPEVIAGGVVTAAADVFSLGGTLFFALEGIAPFSAQGIAETGPLVWGDRQSPDAGRDLHLVLRRMLAADPALRPTMAGVQQALTAVGAGRQPDPGALAPAVAARKQAETPPDGADEDDEPRTISGTLPSGTAAVPVRVQHPVPKPQAAKRPRRSAAPPAAPSVETTARIPATAAGAGLAAQSSSVRMLAMVGAILLATLVGIVVTEIFVL